MLSRRQRFSTRSVPLQSAHHSRMRSHGAAAGSSSAIRGATRPRSHLCSPQPDGGRYSSTISRCRS